MHDSAKPMGRHRVFSLVAGVVVAAVALSPSAYADDDSGSPTGPSIVVGGTVHPPGTIVVDRETPAAATGPINPAQPIVVDPRVRVAPPTCCNAIIAHGKETPFPQWPGVDAKPPVFPVQERVEDNRAAYLDNHGRYWVLDHKTVTLEQVGGWPAPLTTNPSGQPGPMHGSSSIYGTSP